MGSHNRRHLRQIRSFGTLGVAAGALHWLGGRPRNQCVDGQALWPFIIRLAINSGWSALVTLTGLANHHSSR